MQLELARDRKMPVVIHLPHFNKIEGFKHSLAAVDEVGVPHGMVLMDHNTEDTIAEAKAAGFWCGMTVYYTTKLTARRAVDMIAEHGVERVVVNGSADWGVSDPLALPKTIALMRQDGCRDDEIEKIAYANSFEFYSQSGKFKL